MPARGPSTWKVHSCVCIVLCPSGFYFNPTPTIAYQAVKGSVPAYFRKLIRPYTLSRYLRSATSGHLRHLLVAHALLGHESYLFWPHRMTFLWISAQSLITFKRRLKNLSLVLICTLLHVSLDRSIRQMTIMECNVARKMVTPWITV